MVFTGSSIRILRGIRAGREDHEPLLEGDLHHRRHDLRRAVEGHEGLHGADPRARPHGLRHAPAQRFEAPLDATAEHRDAAFGAEVALALQPLDDARAHRHAHRGAGEGAGDEARPRLVGPGEERRAALERLARGHDVDVFLEVEGAEREELAGAREGLHLVDPDRDLRLATAFHQGREELARRGVEAALALHEFEEHGGDAAGVAREVGVERRHAARGRVRVVRVVEGDVAARCRAAAAPRGRRACR